MRYECWSKKRERRLTQTHVWFAWFPVQAGGRCVWLEWVIRTGTHQTGWGDSYYTFKYDLLEQGVSA